ncbi:MAG: complex I NDUFA9 subunit family protein [Methylovirgula sp.]|uniref:complex I NDUFA9 subunit family protein n=1 Tax=Methylovirgula sp. TaxID=1978224 RepID=UPI00307620C6
MNEALRRADRLVTVFGGAGFLGRHVVRALAKDGWLVRVAVRRPDLAFHLQPSGNVGQITAVQANLCYPDSIAAALRNADAAVNLVGILREQGRQTFDAIHREGAANIAAAVRDAGIEHFVHVSALGADPSSASAYGRSKAAGEAAVQAALPGAIILRPSVVFGPEDHFFNRFAALARLSPVMPLIGGGVTKLQPVYAGDVAKAVAAGVKGSAAAGTIYELGGPEVRTLREIIEFILAETERKRFLMPLPFGPARGFGGISELVAKLTLGLMPEDFVLTTDQVELLQQDNVVSATAAAERRTLNGLGIAAESYEALVPTYLTRYRKTGQFGTNDAFG